MLTSEEKARLLELIDHVEKAQECCAPENSVFDTDGNLDFDATCRECPYKGEECDGEKDPRRRDTLEVFRLARKAAEEEPARLLTVEELRNLPIGAVVWEEIHVIDRTLYEEDELTEPLVRTDKKFGNGDTSTGLGEYEMRRYKGVFRWWSAKPTREQIEGTPWEEKEETEEESGDEP